MKLFIFFMIVVAISCQDDSNHGCKTNCDCPDFTTLFNDKGKEDLLFTQGEGCTFNATCKYVAQGAVQALWKDSEIETPTETRDNFFSVIDSEEPVATFDMFSLFGIICEKGAWYITKYPSGIWYWTLDSEEVSFGTTEELDGKKSKIYYAMWVRGQDTNNQGCKVACDCPDFTNLFSSKENLMFTKWDGCTFNATCSPGTPGVLQGKWAGAEFEKPSDADEDQFGLTAGMASSNMYSAFGIICEKGEWYATKYPEGVGYNNIDGDEINIGTAGELDGKKSKIFRAMCFK